MTAGILPVDGGPTVIDELNPDDFPELPTEDDGPGPHAETGAGVLVVALLAVVLLVVVLR